MTDLRLRPLASLASTELPWLRLHDHFVATVGPSAGTGRPFGSLLVLADARFAPHSRFPLHPHREMEILSIVIRGELSHHGDQEHGATLKAREAQLISARGGMVHAEGNDTDSETHMLQIWFTPNARGGTATYYQRSVPETATGGRHLVAGDAEMPLRADAKVWWLDLLPGREERLELPPGRTGYLLAAEANLLLPGGRRLETGEGAEVHGAGTVVTAESPGTAIWIEAAV